MGAAKKKSDAGREVGENVGRVTDAGSRGEVKEESKKEAVRESAQWMSTRVKALVVDAPDHDNVVVEPDGLYVSHPGCSETEWPARSGPLNRWTYVARKCWSSCPCRRAWHEDVVLFVRDGRVCGAC